MARTKTFDEQEVLKKAMTLFWKKGYHATSMQDLVDCLGINRASLYDTYKDKESLYRQAIILYQDLNLSRIRKFLYQHHEVREGFRALFAESIDQNLNDPDRKGCFIVNTTTEMAGLNEEFSDLVRKNQEAMEQLFIDYLSMGKTSGQLPPALQVSPTASYLYTVNSGLMVLARVNTSREKLTSVAETSLQILNPDPSKAPS